MERDGKQYFKQSSICRECPIPNGTQSGPNCVGPHMTQGRFMDGKYFKN